MEEKQIQDLGDLPNSFLKFLILRNEINLRVETFHYYITEMQGYITHWKNKKR